MERTVEQIEAVIDQARSNPGKFSGMTYEEGVMAALEWAIGIAEDGPMED